MKELKIKSGIRVIYLVRWLNPNMNSKHWINFNSIIISLVCSIALHHCLERKRTYSVCVTLLRDVSGRVHDYIYSGLYSTFFFLQTFICIVIFIYWYLSMINCTLNDGLLVHIILYNKYLYVQICIHIFYVSLEYTLNT